MLAKLGLFIAAPFVLTAALLGFTGVVVVDVQEGGPDGMHLVIPVPLILAQTALTFAPSDAKYIECPEAGPYLPIAEEVIEELRKVDDFTLVEVHDGGDDVLVRKIGDEIHVDVRDRNGETVSCRMPLRGLRDMIRSYDGHRFQAKAALRALRHAKRGKLVDVASGEDRIRIRKL